MVSLSSQHVLSRGHVMLSSSHASMQCLWKPWLHFPITIAHSSPLLPRQDKHGSLRVFLHMAQLSSVNFHVHVATATHFSTTKSGFWSLCFRGSPLDVILLGLWSFRWFGLMLLSISDDFGVAAVVVGFETCEQLRAWDQMRSDERGESWMGAVESCCRAKCRKWQY